MMANGIPAVDLRRFRSVFRRREAGSAARDAVQAGDAARATRSALPGSA